MAWENGYWVGDEPTVAEMIRIQELEDDEVGCNCCRYPKSPDELKPYRLNSGEPGYDDARREGRPPFQLQCEMCSGTMIGTYASYPSQHGSDALETMKMIAYGVNLILDRIAGRKPPRGRVV